MRKRIDGVSKAEEAIFLKDDIHFWWKIKQFFSRVGFYIEQSVSKTWICTSIVASTDKWDVKNWGSHLSKRMI